MIVKHILGLDDVISDQAVARSGETNKYGWGFPDAPGHRDPATGACFLSGFYKKADPEYRGRAATPSLVDVEKGVVIRIRNLWPRFTISSPRLASGSTQPLVSTATAAMINGMPLFTTSANENKFRLLS